MLLATLRKIRRELRLKRDWVGPIEVLEACEPGILGEAGPVPRLFRPVGRCLIAEDLLRGGGGAGDGPPGPRILRLTGIPRPLLRLLRPFMRPVRAALRADLVMLSSNLRAFYPDRGLTVKLPHPARPASGESIGREIETRSTLVGTDRVTLPALRPPASGAPSACLIERLVLGSPLLHSAGPRPADLARWLVEFQRANGIAPAALADLCDFAEEWSLFRSYASRRGLSIPDRVDRRVAPWAEPAAGKRLVAKAKCNADLTAANVLVGGDRVYLLDWEYGRETIAAVDATRLSVQLKGFAEAYLAAQSATVRTDPALTAPFDAQLMIACVLAFNDRQRRSVVGPEKLDKRFRSFTRLLAGLADRADAAARNSPSPLTGEGGVGVES